MNSKLTKLSLILFLFLSGSYAYARLASSVLDIRNKLESEIQKNLVDLISTRLDKTTFTVAARVQVKEIPPPKKNDPPKKLETLPAGMSIGAIDVRELLIHYEKQIDEMKLKKESQKEQVESKFEASQIEIVVGLDESYDDSYVSEFKSWLNKRVIADYGTGTKSDVNKVKLKPSFKNEAPKNVEKPTDDEKFKLKDLLSLLTALIIVVGLIIVGILIRSGLKDNGTAKKDLALESKGEWLLKGLNIKDPEVQEEEPTPLPEPVQRLSPRDLEHIIGKIAFVCLELGSQVNDLVRIWIDSGEQGYIKAALLIDTMMAAREKIMSTTGDLPALKIPLDKDIAESQEENLAEVYRQVSSFNDFDRLIKLEQVYWDLITVKTLGLQSLRRPFDFLQGLNQYALKEILDTQRDETKALALMYLPQQSKTEYLNLIEESNKEKIIYQMLTNSQVSQKQIWDIDTSVKVTLINQNAQPTEKLVNLFPRTIEVLQTLDVLSEIQLLRKVSPGLAERGLILKQQYTTLAFIDEWSVEYIKRLISLATNNEIVTLIKIIPECKDLVLGVSSEKVRMIVEDDLKIITSKEPRELAKTLEALKTKWIKIVANENIPMAKVIKKGKKDNESAAA